MDTLYVGTIYSFCFEKVLGIGEKLGVSVTIIISVTIILSRLYVYKYNCFLRGMWKNASPFWQKNIELQMGSAFTRTHFWPTATRLSLRKIRVKFSYECFHQFQETVHIQIYQNTWLNKDALDLDNMISRSSQDFFATVVFNSSNLTLL